MKLLTFGLRSTILRSLIALGVAATLQAQTVRFHTSLGDIDVTLRPDVAPLTVANFLKYLSSGAYTNSIFHRTVYNFIIQGGGYQLVNGAPAAIPPNAAVANEFKLSNVKGTLAMAQSAGDPNSATDEWFFNTVNNAASLDSQSFTVFGSISSAAGLAVMTAIGNVPTYNEGGDFGSVPLVNFTDGATPAGSNYVLVNSIVVLPVTTALGVVNAASYAPALLNGIAPGELLTIYGQNMGPSQITTYTLDGNGVTTTLLAGTRVLFNNGIPGPMFYTSSGQISVVAPYEISGSAAVSVVIEYQGVQSNPIAFNVVPAAPGIFTLDSSGKGDGAIVRNSDGSIIKAGNPASPGDVLLLFGEGQGVAAPALPDGAIVGTMLPYPVASTTLLIDGQTVQPSYAGGAPGDVAGVLQVNFTVPALAPGSHQIQVQSGSGSSAITSPTGVTLQTH